jgi:hypothetical protein
MKATGSDLNCVRVVTVHLHSFRLGDLLLAPGDLPPPVFPGG